MRTLKSKLSRSAAYDKIGKAMINDRTYLDKQGSYQYQYKKMANKEE